MSSETTEQDPDTRDLYAKVQDQEKEIIRLREQIAHASIRQSEILNEKYALERRFSELRVALDEKQREIVTSASSELARRKDDLDANLNLLTELKSTEHEKHIFTTCLLEILGEFHALPHATNASALINSIKNLHDQLQLNIRSYHNKLAKLTSMTGNSTTLEASGLGNTNPQYPSNSAGMGRFSHYGQSMGTRDNAHENMLAEDSRQVTGVRIQQIPNNGSPLRSFSGYNGENMIERNGFTQGLDHMSSHQLAPQPLMNDVPAVTDNNYPWIENFQIVGDAKPGCEISGAGYPRGGTSLCMFQWVRHNPDGTTEFIAGATYPAYVVSVDDVDKLIAVECIPMDEHGRQGDIVRMFANNGNKIACDDEMQDEIDLYLSKGSATFNVLILDSPEKKATLVLRNSNFMVKVEKEPDPLISEKYTKEFSIKIPSVLSPQFVLTASNGISHFFSTNDGRTRDTLVLTMRIFQSKALD